MIRKINCKHGLEKRQELDARRLREKLEEGDKDAIQLFHTLYLESVAIPNRTFEAYLKEKNKVYYSAYVRAVERCGKIVIHKKIMSQ